MIIYYLFILSEDIVCDKDGIVCVNYKKIFHAPFSNLFSKTLVFFYTFKLKLDTNFMHMHVIMLINVVVVCKVY